MKMDLCSFDVEVAVDFEARTGKSIKPLHGVNNSRRSLEKPMEELREAGIPIVRLHDFGGAFGGNLFVDIPNLFPDFDADENAPSSYHFAFTDHYLQQLTASGPEVFFRLGVTIENNWKIEKFRIDPPKDYGKWARICEHVVRHYNEGWADGFHFNIRYWEIWNEPENPSMWSGTRKQFFELYKVASRHLRKCFPKIKIGGYGSCGFYALNTHRELEFFQSFLTWFREFLDFAQAEALPLDFFSWHRYLFDPVYLREESAFVRKELDAHGFGNTESIFDEWNYFDGDSPTKWDDMKEAAGASAVAATMAVLQESPVDMALYYDATPNRAYCGLYYFPSERVTPTYYAFKAFHQLYMRKNEVPVVMQGTGRLHCIAAADGQGEALLVANREKTPATVKLTLCHATRKFMARITDEKRTFELVELDLDKPFVMPPHSVLLLNGAMATETRTTAQDRERTDFAGLSGQ